MKYRRRYKGNLVCHNYRNIHVIQYSDVFGSCVTRLMMNEFQRLWNQLDTLNVKRIPSVHWNHGFQGV